MNETPSDPVDPHQPSWGTPPSTPPAGFGTDDGQHPQQHEQYRQEYRHQTPQTGQPGARFFDAIRSLHVVRPDDGRWAAGVAVGLARRWHVDPTAVRIGFALLTLLGGLGVTLYGLAWLLLPHPDGRIHAQQVLSGTVTPGFIGAVLTVLVSGPHIHLPLLLLALIAFVAWRISAHQRRHRYQGS